MSTGAAPKRSKPILQVKPAAAPGSVTVVANHSVVVGKTSKRALFNSQYSADGGKTWTDGPSSPLATFAITGLTPLATYAIRVRPIVGKVTGEWTQAVTIPVR